MTNLKKRILTSVFLLSLVAVTFINPFILIILLISISIFTLIEFNGLISKIFKNDIFKTNIFKLSIRFIALIYLFFFSALIFDAITQEKPDIKLNTIYLISICICSDVGGFIFGKIFKGKKLTKISPKKTIAGSIGSFILPITLVPFFFNLLPEKFNDIFNLILLSIIVAFICQLGDLFISFLKRKAKVKDTGNLLPGHGGVLDRIDGILFAVPIGMMINEFLIVVI